MTMTSASRGVPRITSAPKRATSNLLVRLVAISTKQQDSPKWNGHMEFLRPHRTRSSSRAMTRSRRMASSKPPFSGSAGLGLDNDHCMGSLYPFSRPALASLSRTGSQSRAPMRYS